MRTFAQKQNQPQKPVSSNLALSHTTPGLHHRTDLILFLQRTTGNQAVQRMVIGADCDRDAVAEAARLLRHEQGHFDLTCKLVGRADDALAAGRPLVTLKQWLNTNNNAQQQQYEDDTMNGCVASEQAKWQTAIAGGLKAVPGP